ncbi:odorant receptor 94b-like [Temnothorax curvispinosus]|uniref:Odorant receptor n=1 Tax=Temnothorax curvispinosus TaxID=300111 RepID=A0A6J1PTN4_9HYME|nr:odorant receptor 94b-like [Temnothorax curvispinosus]
MSMQTASRKGTILRVWYYDNYIATEYGGETRKQQGSCSQKVIWSYHAAIDILRFVAWNYAITLKILTVVGCWPPDSWTTLCKRTVYNIYTTFVVLLLCTFLLFQLLDIILNVDNTDDFTDTFYFMLAMVNSCCKIVGLLVNRKNIGILTNILTQKPFIPLEADEIEIRHKFDRTIQINTLWYTILIETTCASTALISLFTDFRKSTLTYREWTPYNYTSEVVFCVIYARQLVCTFFGSMVNIACDSLICGLLLHVCCQIEILECRLKKVSLGQNNLRECVRQHNCIFKFALMVNEKFKIIIAIQFVVSTLVVCFNLYQLAKMTLSAQCFPLILYTFAMLTQILIYCWYGNEVKLKSVQLAANIFGMGWLKMKQSRKQNLLMIMNRSLTPIEFSSAYIITMNLDSFVGVSITSH